MQRKVRSQVDGAGEARDFKRFRFGAFMIDPSRRSLRRGDVDITLRPQSFDVLCYLIERAGTIVSKEELIEAVWSSQPASDDSVMQCIKDIRKALGESDRASVRTIPKHGYLFAAKIEGLLEGPPAGPATAAGQRDLTEELHDRDEQPSAGSPIEVGPAQVAVAQVTAAPLPPALGPTERWRSKPIAAGLVFGLCIAGTLLAAHRLASPAPDVLTMMAAPSVTVLPFLQVNDGDRGPAGMLADNVVVELTRVSRGVDIPVAFARDARAPADVTRKHLGTRYALLGNVQSDGVSRRAGIRLVEAMSDRLVWAHQFEYPLDEAGAESRAAVQIARLTAHQLLVAESRRPLPASPSADHYVILGRVLMDGEQGPKANSDARALFEKGHALDDSSIPALVGLAQTLITSVLNNWVPEDQRSAFLDRADALLQRVIALDWRNVRGHFLRGELARAREDYEQAVAAYEYTMGLHPNYPHAHAAIGRVLIELGRAKDSIPYIEDAVRLSPTDPGAWIWCHWAGMAAVHVGDYETAMRWLRRSREANHAYDGTVFWLALASAGLDRMEEARSLMAEYLAMRPQTTTARWPLRRPYRDAVVAQRSRLEAMMRELGVPEPAAATEGRPLRQ